MSFKYTEKVQNKYQKETKWDRISKRYSKAKVLGNKSEAIKRLITKDFISQKQHDLMVGNEKKNVQFDPVLVMDLRHKMGKEFPEKAPLISAHYRKASLDSCKHHNITVEDHYLKNQLNCFRESLTKQYKHINIKEKELHKYPWLIDNTPIMNSLEFNEKTVQHFYETPLVMLNKVHKLLRQHKKSLDESLPKKSKEFPNDQIAILKAMPSEKQPTQNLPDMISQGFKETHCKGKNIDEDKIENILNVQNKLNIDAKKENDKQHLPKQSGVTSSFTESSCNEHLDAVITEITSDALLELQIEKQEKCKKKNVTINEEISLNKRNESSALEKAENHSTCISEDQISYTKKKNIENHGHGHQNICNILRKYFLKWVHFTNIEKIEREYASSKADRVQKINIFLDKIRFEKTRLNANVNCRKTLIDKTKITKKYQNKIKVQQDIIDLQRIKLERQERVIVELKLSKIAEESKEARKELSKEIKDMARLGDPRIKAKAKCLQFLGNIKDEDERDERLQSNGVEIPKFLRKMQERALERSIKHEQVKERRLRLEAMKEAQKLAAEEARRLEDENAKRLRIKQLKEKRLQEKMAKELKERERQRAIANIQKAEQFSRRRLLRVGIEGFKKLIQRKQEILGVLNKLRITFYQRNCFQCWATTYYIAKFKRDQKARELYESTLKRRALQTWFNYTKDERSKMFVAIDWNDLKLTNLTFGKWARYTETVRMINDTKMIQATSHHEWQLKWKVMDCWQRLPHILKLEKEAEERRQRWRMKIWELLPDYLPNREELNYT